MGAPRLQGVVAHRWHTGRGCCCRPSVADGRLLQNHKCRPHPRRRGQPRREAARRKNAENEDEAGRRAMARPGTGGVAGAAGRGMLHGGTLWLVGRYPMTCEFWWTALCGALGALPAPCGRGSAKPMYDSDYRLINHFYVGIDTTIGIGRVFAEWQRGCATGSAGGTLRGIVGEKQRPRRRTAGLTVRRGAPRGLPTRR